jgi:predicted O-linked N-acetylglucosamine transferase (SPINDLY family)
MVHLAIQSFEKTTLLDPYFIDAHHSKGRALHSIKEFSSAIKSYKVALQLKNDQSEVWMSLGLAEQANSGLSKALEYFNIAISIRPEKAEQYVLKSNVLIEMGDLLAAKTSLLRSVCLSPNDPNTFYSLGQFQRKNEESANAERSFKSSLELEPTHTLALRSLGNMHYNSGHFRAALQYFVQDVVANPDDLAAYTNCAVTYSDLNLFDRSLKMYDQVLQIQPGHALSIFGKGVVFKKLNQQVLALREYEHALELDPSLDIAHHNRGHTFYRLKELEKALTSFKITLKLNSKIDYLLGTTAHIQMSICDWSEYEKNLKLIQTSIEKGLRATASFAYIALDSNRRLQVLSAKTWIEDHAPLNPALGLLSKYLPRKKIRIGYFSSDLRLHPVSILLAGVFEHHTKEEFEIIAFYFGPESKDAMQMRLVSAFDQFHEVRDLSDLEIAKFSRQLEIDIAVDLGGLTTDNRVRVFSYRAAPIQISYIGYLGSMGATYFDYIVADPVIIPPEQRKDYLEKIAYLPFYQANDSKRKISDRVFTREELNLPPNGFVFCCFNNNYKITPSTFNIWMQILKAVNGSVLFLLADNPQAQVNLQKEAVLRGIDPSRLVFGERLEASEYLARYKVADLFLDTLPYNAGTTASDALWAGLPVLTCMGESFAGRVAASILTALELPELVTQTSDEYIKVATDLAKNSVKMQTIKEQLVTKRKSAPLFNTSLFTKNLEDLYKKVYKNYQADKPIDHILLD